MPLGEEEGQRAAQEEERNPQTLFLEDTVGVEKDGAGLIGIIARTWHDLDDQDAWEDVEDAIAGAMVSETEFKKFKRTGQPPRHYFLFAPSSPQYQPMLVHESECSLLDRALAFGDVVKRSLTSPQSGTVTAVHTAVGIRHSYPETETQTAGSLGDDEGYVPNVPESELSFVNEWNEDDFVIYKNCWMGVVDESVEDVTVRLENGSVVVVDNPYDIEIPVTPLNDVPAFEGDSSRPVVAEEARRPSVTTRRPAGVTPRPKTVAAPPHLSPGQTVSTTKANLRRGRWLYGAYNASIPAIGVVVEVKTVRLGVHWLCQNMMVAGRFVAVPRPPTWIEEDEFDKLRRFKKSTGGYVDMEGTPLMHSRVTCPGGELQVGDRVRFVDLKTAAEKYPGKFKVVTRGQMLGFDVNTFVVVETKTSVRVQWQDMTETCEEARNLVPYLNVDDHDVWPGEIVIMKPEDSAKKDEIATPPSAAPQDDRHRIQFENMWRTFSSVAQPESPLPQPEYMRIKKVGVVQTANPADRVAKVKWFVDPNVEVAGGVMIPGSVTGQLEQKEEDVSFYEAMSHQALGCRRGDFVLIAPERPLEDEPASPASNGESMGGLNSVVGDLSAALSASPARSLTPSLTPDSPPEGHLAQMVDSLRGMVDGGLLSNLSATLGNSTHPQLQAVSRLLNQFPALMAGQQGPSLSNTPGLGTAIEDAYLSEAPAWIGEVVDLGLDGLITVRLGALDEPADVRVPIERLHIIFNEDMDLGDSDDEDDEESEEDSEDEFSSEDEMDDEPEAIEERVIYEGGQRLDNGGEEDWLTDEDADDMDVDGDDYSIEDMASTKKEDDEEDAEKSSSSGQFDREESKKPLEPPPLPDNVPAPEAFAISTSERTPPRFAILEAEIPTDHAFATQPATPMASAFARRINKEHKILSTSLPEGIMVRTWESRLDLLRVMIVGPLNTPYELAPFVFDFYFPPSFPVHPPRGYFHSWTGGVGRVNPNLYEDGKICLSLLGTWHAERKNEGWSANGSSVLQLLVSLMGLVLVREPWYNEAGFNVYQGAEEAALNSKLYSEKAYILARGFVKTVLTRPVQGFEKEVLWLYLPHGSAILKFAEGEESWAPGPELLEEVVKKAADVVRRSENGEEALGTEGVGKVSAGALVLLKRDLTALEGLLKNASEGSS